MIEIKIILKINIIKLLLFCEFYIRIYITKGVDIMLKIYNAYSKHGEIKVEDYIDFSYGQFDTGLYGFGQVKSGNFSCERANYELQKLEAFKEYLQKVKVSDGYVEDFLIWNPFNYEMLEEKYKDIPRNFDIYEKCGLNEEAILLFTNWVHLTYPDDDSVQRIFGRHLSTAMYLVMPNASFCMSTGDLHDDVQENYEVLQSQTLGKQLLLTKMKRKI